MDSEAKKAVAVEEAVKEARRVWKQDHEKEVKALKADLIKREAERH